MVWAWWPSMWDCHVRVPHAEVAKVGHIVGLSVSSRSVSASCCTVRNALYCCTVPYCSITYGPYCMFFVPVLSCRRVT
jgi:hypothetical protein